MAGGINRRLLLGCLGVHGGEHEIVTRSSGDWLGVGESVPADPHVAARLG